jgi:peptide/nickel transport system ATP-binding protein
MALLFITHDLSLAAAVAGEILVMDRGRIVDRGRAASVIARPAHVVTRRLVEARPGPLPGEVRGPG